MPSVISRPCAAPRIADLITSMNPDASAIRWSAANDPMTASGSRRAITAAASAIAAQESRGDGSTRMFSSGTPVSWRDTAAACATPVTTYTRSGAASGVSRSTVAWSSDDSVPVSGCRNFG
jgi:hypothetical protein